MVTKASSCGGILKMSLSRTTKDLHPAEIKLLREAKALQIAFTDGAVFKLPAELLRVISPAANSAKLSPGQPGPKVVAGRKFVNIMKVELVGNYAVRLQFDDLHATGLYTWPLLYELGQNKISHMRKYIQGLKSQDLSRIPQEMRKQNSKGGDRL